MAVEVDKVNGMNLEEVTITSLVDNYKFHMQCLKNKHKKYIKGECTYDVFRKQFRNILVVGPVGLGKTVAIKQLTKELNWGYSELRLVGRGETDLIGVPYLVNGRTDDEKYTKFAELGIFPKVYYTYAEDDVEHKTPLRDENGKAILQPGSDPEYGVLVIDELLSASPSIQAVILQLLDDSRGIGTYKFPDTWMIVACGNGAEDGGYFEGMSSALLSRFKLSYYLVPDFNAWLPWAYANKIHPYILAYLTNHPEHFHCLRAEAEKESGSEGVRFPVPREWESFSSILWDMEELEIPITSPLFKQQVGGAIGRSYGADFMAFVQYSGDLEDVNAIFEGRPNLKTFKDIPKTEARYIVINNLTTSMYDMVVSDLKKNNNTISDAVMKRCENAFTWLAANGRIDYDVVTSAMASITSVMPTEFNTAILLSDSMNTKEFNELLSRYKTIMRLA